jgi:hypothetical protein
MSTNPNVARRIEVAERDAEALLERGQGRPHPRLDTAGQVAQLGDRAGEDAVGQGEGADAVRPDDRVGELAGRRAADGGGPPEGLGERTRQINRVVPARREVEHRDRRRAVKPVAEALDDRRYGLAGGATGLRAREH